MEKIPILICGTRTFDLGLILPYVLGPTILPIIHQVEIVEGGSEVWNGKEYVHSGADYQAELFAKYYGLRHKQFKADWLIHGRAAGPKRNTEMASYVKSFDRYYAFAFWDGRSRGTVDMMSKVKCTMHQYLPLDLYFKPLLMEWQDKFKYACRR